MITSSLKDDINDYNLASSIQHLQAIISELANAQLPTTFTLITNNHVMQVIELNNIMQE